MTAKHNKVGSVGEVVAANFLNNKGLTIVETNFSRSWGELDIIALQDTELVFGEVKTTQITKLQDIPNEGDNKHRPEERVDYYKKQRLRRIIQTYVHNHTTDSQTWRVDIICVYLDTSNKEAYVNWIKNVII